MCPSMCSIQAGSRITRVGSPLSPSKMACSGLGTGIAKGRTRPASCERGYYLLSTEITESLKLSVVVPVYNSQETLRKLIEELASTLRGIEYEVVLVNDGSQDQSLSICCEIASENQRVLLVESRQKLRPTQRDHGRTKTRERRLDCPHR